jgi:hypothetical protein
MPIEDSSNGNLAKKPTVLSILISNLCFDPNPPPPAKAQKEHENHILQNKQYHNHNCLPTITYKFHKTHRCRFLHRNPSLFYN